MEHQAVLTQQLSLELQRERQQLNMLLFEAIDKKNETKVNALRDAILTMNEEIRRLDNILAAAVQGVFVDIYFFFFFTVHVPFYFP